MSDEAYTGQFIRHLELQARGVLPKDVSAPVAPASTHVTHTAPEPHVNGEPLVSHVVRSMHKAALGTAQPN